MNLLNVATILCIGLLVGAELAVSVFVNPVLFKLDFAAQAGAIRLFARRLGTAMPVWYIASLLLLIASTMTRLHRPGVILLASATGIWVAAIGLSLYFLVPINNRIAAMRADAFTPAARQEHRKWDTLHRVRVAILAVAMIFVLAATGI
jgi:uncharacterized membrane protein